MTRHLITTIRQVDGGTRELYAATANEAREARETLRRDPSLIDSITVSEHVDVARDGSRTRYAH